MKVKAKTKMKAKAKPEDVCLERSPWETGWTWAHVQDNQGLCHYCGKLLALDLWELYAGEGAPPPEVRITGKGSKRAQAASKSRDQTVKESTKAAKPKRRGRPPEGDDHGEAIRRLLRIVAFTYAYG